MLGLIIFGTRGVTYRKAKGNFSCPACQTLTSYRHRRQRRFFTLYFIPVIPLDLLNEWVECDQCRGTFKMAVLELMSGQTGGAYGEGSGWNPPQG